LLPLMGLILHLIFFEKGMYQLSCVQQQQSLLVPNKLG
jgi:hypothetical protein